MITAVTGAAGFLGSAVVRRLLARGRRVRAVLEPNKDARNLDGLDVEKVECDVTDARGMARALEGCGSLFHLAAIYTLSSRDPARVWRVNVEGTSVTLLAAMRAGVARVVHTSSTLAIGLVPGGIADERAELDPRDVPGVYTLTKWQSERLALRFAEAGLSLVVVNPGVPFGPGDRAPTPTGRVVLAILRGEAPPVIGPAGLSTVDVDDCAEGHVLAEERGRAGERYILSAHNVMLEELTRAVEGLAGQKRFKLRLSARASEALAWALERVDDDPLVTRAYARYAMRRPFFTSEKAQRELGFRARPLEESLARAIAFFRDARMV